MNMPYVASDSELQLSTMEDCSDDGTELSPEPSPHGPPQPQPIPICDSTPKTVDQRQQFVYQDTSEEEESLPSLPEAPSPYSPPPNSLFSGESWQRSSKGHRRRRPPLHEVRLTSERANGGQAGGKNDDDEAVVATNQTFASEPSLGHRIHRLLRQEGTPVSFRDPFPPQSAISIPPISADRSHLLPAVLALKRDLQTSHQSLYLLQQENKALSSECDRFSSQYDVWQENFNRQLDLSRQQQEGLEQEVEHLKQQNHLLVEERKAAAINANENIERLKREKAEALEETESVRTSLQDAIHLLESEKEQLEIEKTSTDSKWKKDLKRLESERTEAETCLQQRIETLEKEKALVASRLQEKMDDLIAEKVMLESQRKEQVGQLEKDQKLLKAELAEQIKVLATDATSVETGLRHEVQHLEKALETAMTEKTIQELKFESLVADNLSYEQQLAEKKEENDSLSKTLAQLRRSADSGGDRKVEQLQTELLDAKARVKSATIQGARKTQQAKEGGEKKSHLLQGQVNSLRLEVDQLKAVAKESERRHRKQMAETERKTDDLQQEVKNLKRDLDESTERANQLMGNKAACCYDQDEIECSSAAGASHSISERLLRIRDVAERARIDQNFRRELTRIRAQHEGELKSVKDSHEQTLKDIVHGAKVDVTTKAKDYKRRLQSEYEVEIEDMRRKHDAQVTQVKVRLERELEESEKALEATINQLSATTKELEREMIAREGLQQTVQDLEERVQQYQHDQFVGRSELETNTLQEGWAKKTMELVTSIQKDCNDVFDRRKRDGTAHQLETMRERWTDPSPSLTKISEPTHTYRDRSAHVLPVWHQSRSSWKPNTASIDIDKALDETEAIIRSLTGVDALL
ncbi:predicted protein [Phaeodactylum tricornutum CCAP 1055/1]|uniref:Uncharacterized protein n=1 Tax=Phaeodactylum tricornutum (strain CCAP 1055/1) TaxID=556484 RepID=B7G3B2_PHATC|nr:predicted protein [Phaeodactylum tricornutum CCAP 1055/1]EEC46801.1 predicted protein [Phaeodactylum tricornutum CCAP 1055/1]|eukprot:XP_002181587.1 predicted protein [Phaeodactylum tricornutum CCAP 1055/1]